MKDQYFGDINDYKKYGLVRILSRFGAIKTTICWMLTPSDDSVNGSSIEYLHKSKYWRDHDSDLYDYLRQTVILKKERNVRLIEKSGLFINTGFFPELLPDDKQGRETYFALFKKQITGSHLIFFDPDNGIEVKSTPYGHKGSSKYIYWRELIDFFSLGYSILGYQHFPRMNRDTYIERLAKVIISKLNPVAVYFFYTSRALFYLITTKKHQAFFHSQLKVLDVKWGKQVKLIKDISKRRHQLSLNYE